MEENIFGQEINNNELFSIIYNGSSFVDGVIPLSDLQKQLKSVEDIVNSSIQILIKTNKLNDDFKEYQVLVSLERGSIKQFFNVIFTKNTAKIILNSPLVAGLIIASYTHYLNERQTEQFSQEIAMIQKDESYKKNLKNILSPLNNNDDSTIINYGDINININTSDKEKIYEALGEENIKEDVFKNGEYNETLYGSIRKIDLDASGNNYFGFNIDKGPSKVPTAISGEFNLNLIKSLIDTHLEINAKVRYKDGKITHIEIISYKDTDVNTNTLFN